MSTVPRDRGPDSTLAYAREGYQFITRRCERYGSDVFQTRLLLAPAICLRGAEAARLFYDEDRFIRHRAAPIRVRRTLFGRGGVQELDDPDHRDRKAMLMSMMGPASIARLKRIFSARWQNQMIGWANADRVTLYDELGCLLARTVCEWAGVPLPEARLRQRTDDLRSMIESPTAVGLPYLRGRWGRIRTEHWIGGLIDQVRAGTFPAAEGSPLRIVATHRGTDGAPLDRRSAAVELINILRPTVAIDRFIVFAALALHEHPYWMARLRTDEHALEPFVQEVRRYFPLFPAAIARVRTPFQWRGMSFPQGRRVLLDIYGTDHHPQVWADPDRFRPERFHDWSGDPYTLIPQGGGDHYRHHRCPGEWITIALMKIGVTALTRWMRYTVPAQDLSVNLRRIPTLPESGFQIARVRPI